MQTSFSAVNAHPVAMPAPSASISTPNIRGAVPAPKENSRMPYRSLEAHSANSDSAISATPPI